jgi:hypothetical protein
MANESTVLSRREAAKVVGGSLAFGLLVSYLDYEIEQGDCDPESIFVELGRDFTTPDQVALAFSRADTGFLMASYSVFFPEFLAKYGPKAVDALQAAAEKQKGVQPRQNPHRLDALPAVAAAHWVPRTNNPEMLHRLSKVICRGLEDPRREVREIILQNLVTSTAANYDSITCHSVSRTVIDHITKIISEASDTEDLMTPALCGTEFLLNARALLKTRGVPPQKMKPYDQALQTARQLKASHLNFIPKLIELHENSFHAANNDVSSLPPHSSEALMGWKLYAPRNHEYINLLAQSRARLAYTVFKRASGQTPTTPAMSQEEANIALPKIMSFIRAFQLSELIQQNEAVNDIGFAKFIRGEFKHCNCSPPGGHRALGITAAAILTDL